MAIINAIELQTRRLQLPGSDPEEAISTQPQPQKPRSMTGVTWVFVVAGLLIAHFLVVFNGVIAGSLFLPVTKDFRNTERLPWLVNMYFMVLASITPLWGRAFALFNIKYLFLVAMFIFQIGNILCGAANSIGILVAGQIVCGLGGAGLYMGTINILSRLTTVQERPIYLGFTGISWGIGTIVGSLLGGVVADSTVTWRCPFYIDLGMGAVSAPVYVIFLPSMPSPVQGTLTARLCRIDYFGAFLYAAALISGAIAITFGGVTYTWSDRRVIGPLVWSGLLWSFFAIQQTLFILTRPEARIFPFQMVASWEMCILFAQAASAIGTAIIPIYFIPMYFRLVRGALALQAGIKILPNAATSMVSILFSGFILSQYGFYAPLYLIGSLLTMVGGVLMSATSADANVSVVLGLSVLISIGGGFYTQTSFAIAQTKQSSTGLAAVVSFITIGQTLGAVASLVAANAIFLNTASEGIHQILPGTSSIEVREAVLGTWRSSLQTVGLWEQQGIREAVFSSIRNVWLLMVAGSVLSVIISIPMKWERLLK